MRFNQTVYRVNEDDGPVQPSLVLSNPSSYDVTIQVNDDEITATSKYTIIPNNAIPVEKFGMKIWWIKVLGRECLGRSIYR